MDKSSPECRSFFYRCLKENTSQLSQVKEQFQKPGCWQDWYYSCLNPPVVTPLALTVALLVLAFFSAVGNIVVCIVFYLYSHLQLVKHFFVVNLSVADIIIVAVSVPLYAAYNLGFGPGNWSGTLALCHAHLVMDILCGTAGILSLAVISVERYIAVVYPLRYNGSVTPYRAAYALAAIWGYSIIVCGIILLSFIAPGKDDFRDKCLFLGRQYATFVALASFVFPLAIMMVTYSRIFVVALGQARRIDSMLPVQSLPNDVTIGQRPNRATGAVKLKRELKAAKTVTLIMGTHILCWCPLFVFILVHSYCSSCRRADSMRSMQSVLYVSLVLRYLNTLANPIVYSGINGQFRDSVMKFLFRRKISDRDLLATRDVSLSQNNNNVMGILPPPSFNL